MAIKYTDVFHCKTLQKLVKKYAIWQPWSGTWTI
jgi:hypothetical protein